MPSQLLEDTSFFATVHHQCALPVDLSPAMRPWPLRGWPLVASTHSVPTHNPALPLIPSSEWMQMLFLPEKCMPQPTAVSFRCQDETHVVIGNFLSRYTILQTVHVIHRDVI